MSSTDAASSSRSRSDHQGGGERLLNIASCTRTLALALALMLPAFWLPAAATESPAVTIRISEWRLPAPMFGRSVAASPDGGVYVAVPNDNKVVRFDPRTQSFRQWEMPDGHQPNSILVDRNGTVWTAGYGNGTIGRLRPASGMIAEFAVPSGGGAPHSLAVSEDGATLWFTMQTGDKIGSVDTATGRIVEYATSGRPRGITLDQAGHVWWCRNTDNKLGRLEPLTGKISEVDLGRDSRPRRIATAPDGMLWVTLYGKGQLARINPQTMKVLKTYQLPGGNAGAHSVAIGANGIVWVNELPLDSVVRFDPVTGLMQSIRLPSPNNGIRNLSVDGAGRVWYAGTRNGKLGALQ